MSLSWIRALQGTAAKPTPGLRMLLVSARAAEEYQDELSATLRRAAMRGGWDMPSAAKPSVSRRRRPARAAEEEECRQRMPDGFEFPSDDEDDEIARPACTGTVPEDADAGDALEFLGELTLCANIDHSVDAEQARIQGMTEGEFEKRRCQAEEDIMEQHAEADRAEAECQEAAASAFDDLRG
eukprot:TRINITY_DN607_c0_g1_i1.p2 TRINITY_DN607_c0_g1~~TRINITY_DN607_c0_g1_i1.p2  ORF type:complete len:183 (+),score=81.32 TRINITY_DN607_c0_g1_i1:68-616(+)